MLSQLLADHAALHCALGFKFRTPGILLRNFVNFAELRGEHIITTGTVREWALQAPSPKQRRNRLLTVRRAIMTAGNSRATPNICHHEWDQLLSNAHAHALRTTAATAAFAGP